MLVKFLFGMIGAFIYVNLFYFIAVFWGWHIPSWGYVVVGWMGHDAFYEYLTYVRR